MKTKIGIDLVLAVLVAIVISLAPEGARTITAITGLGMWLIILKDILQNG